MIVLTHLYCGKTSFEAFLNQNQISCHCNCLARIYTPASTHEQAVAIASEIREVLPNAGIFGASGSGVIFDGAQLQNDTLVVLEISDKTIFKVNTFSFLNKTAKEIAKEVAGQPGCSAAPLMHVVFGEHYYDVNDFVTEFNKLNSFTKLAGGIAGDVLPLNIGGFVFTENGIITDGLVTAMYSNKSLNIYCRTNISHEQISPIYTLDQTKDSLLLQIENRPAVDWFKEQLGIKSLDFYTDWQTIAENDSLLRFPIILEGHSGASRFIKYDPDKQNMSLYFSQLPPKTQFRMGYVSPIKCVTESYSICHELERFPIESLFCYTCLFRKLYLQNCAEWELRPFAGLGVCGVFMMGEIACIDGVNQFLNGSCCFSGVAEDNTTYIHPDYSVFSDLYQIKDDNENLLHFVLKKQSEEMSKENKNLLAKLLTQQTQIQNQLYVDPITGIQNELKFLEDNQEICFNKLFMISIENAELIFSRLSKDGYYRNLRALTQEIQDYCTNSKLSTDIHFYSQNETTLFLAANDKVAENDFIELANGLYRQIQYKKLDSETEFFVNRFVLVLNQNDLIDKALNAMKASVNLQTDYLTWDSSIDAGRFQAEEMNMISVLNQAVENNLVIPYFQGIYNNQTKRMNKYEALIRIKDANGKVYYPNDFMDVAKKYHLYSKISISMIKQVLTLFAGRSEVVSINISAYDVNFNSSCKQIFEMLDEIGDASNFVFEILEDEKFRDMDMLKQFIVEVKKYGVKIAIDDFGRGYSNFMEIAKIQPDYIKIDGSIILDIASNELHKKVSRNIVFLGSQLEADLVAEFVETDEIQKVVEELGIKYSQGYFFSRPAPFEDLNLEK